MEVEIWAHWEAAVICGAESVIAFDWLAKHERFQRGVSRVLILLIVLLAVLWLISWGDEAVNDRIIGGLFPVLDSCRTVVTDIGQWISSYLNWPFVGMVLLAASLVNGIKELGMKDREKLTLWRSVFLFLDFILTKAALLLVPLLLILWCLGSQPDLSAVCEGLILWLLLKTAEGMAARREERRACQEEMDQQVWGVRPLEKAEMPQPLMGDEWELRYAEVASSDNGFALLKLCGEEGARASALPIVAVYVSPLAQKLIDLYAFQEAAERIGKWSLRHMQAIYPLGSSGVLCLAFDTEERETAKATCLRASEHPVLCDKAWCKINWSIRERNVFLTIQYDIGLYPEEMNGKGNEDHAG